jgi:hypothetical protein
MIVYEGSILAEAECMYGTDIHLHIAQEIIRDQLRLANVEGKSKDWRVLLGQSLIDVITSEMTPGLFGYPTHRIVEYRRKNRSSLEAFSRQRLKYRRSLQGNPESALDTAEEFREELRKQMRELEEDLREIKGKRLSNWLRYTPLSACGRIFRRHTPREPH